MTDDIFPGHDRDQDPDGHPGHPGPAFAGEFGDEPPLTDLVPRALAVYQRGRRRRQAAGVGGAVAAVAATVLATTQLLGGTAPNASASVTAPGARDTAPLKPVPTLAHPPSPAHSTAGAPPSTPATSSTSSTAQSRVPCDWPLALQDVPDTVPVPNQAAARNLCQLGLSTMARLLPGDTWLPAPDRFLQTAGTYLPYSFAPDHDADSPLALSISTKPPFPAACANVWYPQTTCRDVTLADNTRGIEFDSLPSGDKPGGYELAVDLPGGRQLQFQTGYQAGGPQPVTLETFLKVIKNPVFAQYLKQYEAIMLP